MVNHKCLAIERRIIFTEKIVYLIVQIYFAAAKVSVIANNTTVLARTQLLRNSNFCFKKSKSSTEV